MNRTTISVDEGTSSSHGAAEMHGHEASTRTAVGLLDPHSSKNSEADAVSMVSLRSVHAHRVVELQMMHTRRIEIQNQAMHRPRPSTAVRITLHDFLFVFKRAIDVGNISHDTTLGVCLGVARFFLTVAGLIFAFKIRT